jgi:hypothetical protein
MRECGIVRNPRPATDRPGVPQRRRLFFGLTQIAMRTKFKMSISQNWRLGHDARMKKAIHPLLNVRLRPIEPRDFGFIRTLAAEFPTFTIPSEYLLWFLSRFHPEYCRIIEHESGALKAYLLAMPTTKPRDGIAIWQVAAATPNHPFALEYFTAYLRDLAEHLETKFIFFTSPMDSTSLRLIRSLAKQFFGCGVAQVGPVPSGQGECEFRLNINADYSKKKQP